MTETSPLRGDAVRGVKDAALREVIAAHWEWMMAWAPTWATTLGDHRYDDRLAPRDAASIARCHRERRELLAQAARVPAASLDPDDNATWMLLVASLHGAAAPEVAAVHEWAVSSRGGLVDEISYLCEMHPLGTSSGGDALLGRLRASVAWIDDTIANLRIGLRAGRVAAREPVRRAIVQLDALFAQPTDAWAMAAPARATYAWDSERFARELLAIVDGAIAPALRRYRELLDREILPRGRTGAVEGLCGLKHGDIAYRAYVDMHIGTGQTPDELHAIGLREIARSDDAIASLGRALFGAPDLASTIARLRDDRSLYFADAPALVRTAGDGLARAKTAIPRFFGRLPVADCVMREIPAHEAPFTTIAYYREPHYDGSKPGEYFVNTYKPEVRPRFELEALTYHESIPGHHLQIAIAQELTELPLFRKLAGGSTAYIEGWALYTERLADEMGLYTGDLDRLGMHSYDAWRASRLVVDTGLHAMGWTRAQAEAFMLAHTALTPENISNEVDRYITDPGQALAYKVGQLAILELRGVAERTLGARFDLRAFHDALLKDGALTLPVLTQRMGDWLRDAGADFACYDDHGHSH
jgi:uncharacterized protein (DUF885 family)